MEGPVTNRWDEPQLAYSIEPNNQNQLLINGEREGNGNESNRGRLGNKQRQ